jgi:hypothetical protein
VEEELTVAFRSRQARVYDPRGLRPPRQRRLGQLADDAAPRPGIADDPAASLAAARLELRLHEHDRLPARASQVQQRRQRLPDADERDVADHELRRERQLRDVPRVRPLDHDHAWVLADTRVELAIADVESNDASGAALEKDVREAACRRADVEAVATGRIDAERV